MAKVYSVEKILPKRFNPFSRVHERYRQTTDGFAIAKTRTYN